MTLPAAPVHSLVPELGTVARFGLRQLSVGAVAAIDERHEPPRLVACEGPHADELIAGLEALPSMRAAPRSFKLSFSTSHGRAVVSAPLQGEGGRIGTMHVLAAPGQTTADRDMRRKHVLALAAQIGLVLARTEARRRSGGRVAPQDPLAELNSLASLPDAIPRLTPAVTRGLADRFGATTACIVVWDGDRAVLRALPGAFGTPDQALSDSIMGPPSNPHSLAVRVFATGQPYVTNRAAQDQSLHQHYVDVLHLQRVLAVPLTVGTYGVGVLMIANKPEPFNIEDVLELERLAPRIATAVELVLSIEKIRRRERMERILTHTATEVASGRSLAACLTPALEALGQATGSSIAVLSPRAAPPLIWRRSHVDPGLERSFMEAARDLPERRARAYPRDAGDPGWATAHAPVMFSGERVATVSLLRLNGISFGTDEEEALSRLANLAALAWADERYQRQLAELALSRERVRIADALHDRVAQILFAAQIGVDSLLEGDDRPPDETRRLLEIRALLARGETSVREVINEYAPPPANLVHRLTSTVEVVTEQFRAAVELELPPEDRVADVTQPVSECLVKVAHEATINAAKHAGPCTIRLNLRADGESLVLDVEDDGRGLAPGFTNHHGLSSLQRAVSEAGGTLLVAPHPRARGTLVSARFSLAVAGLSS